MYEPREYDLSITIPCILWLTSLCSKYSRSDQTNAFDNLVKAFRRMRALEIKWAVRLLQRDIRPAVILETMVLMLTHPKLSRMLQIYNSPAALEHVGVRRLCIK